MSENYAKKLLQKTKVVVAPETFTLVSLSESAWFKVLENPALSPRMTSPFMIFRDSSEVTLLLDSIDFDVLRDAVDGANVENGFRLLTFDQILDLNITGFLALVSGILSHAGVPILALSAFSRDHILIKQDDLTRAFAALRDHVDEIC